jgi:hypothetical protein
MAEYDRTFYVSATVTDHCSALADEIIFTKSNNEAYDWSGLDWQV